MNHFANFLHYHTHREQPSYYKSPKADKLKKELTFSPQFSPDEPNTERLRITNKFKYKNKFDQNYFEDKENIQNTSNFVQRRIQKQISPKKESKNNFDASYPIDQILTNSVQSTQDLVQIDSVRKQSDQVEQISVQEFQNDDIVKSFKKIKIQSDEDYVTTIRQHIQTPRQQQIKNISFVMYKKQVEGRI